MVSTKWLAESAKSVAVHRAERILEGSVQGPVAKGPQKALNLGTGGCRQRDGHVEIQERAHLESPLDGHLPFALDLPKCQDGNGRSQQM